MVTDQTRTSQKLVLTLQSDVPCLREVARYTTCVLEWLVGAKNVYKCVVPKLMHRKVE